MSKTSAAGGNGKKRKKPSSPDKRGTKNPTPRKK